MGKLTPAGTSIWLVTVVLIAYILNNRLAAFGLLSCFAATGTHLAGQRKSL
jgi:hypothetical protein